MGYNPDIHKHPNHLFINFSNYQLLGIHRLLLHYWHEHIENDKMSEWTFKLFEDYIAHTNSEIRRREKGGLWLKEEEIEEGIKYLKKGHGYY